VSYDFIPAHKLGSIEDFDAVRCIFRRVENMQNDIVPMALEYERHLVAPLSRRDRATLDRLVRILLGRAVELGPAHAE